MQYMGSKARFGEIVRLIETDQSDGKRWVEPFAGALGISQHVESFDELVLNDALPGLMDLFEQIRLEQFTPPRKHISRIVHGFERG